MSIAKPFSIPKQLVWRAYLAVKSKGGAAGVDNQSLEDFERDLKNNLYRIWNRYSMKILTVIVQDVQLTMRLP